MAAHTYWRLYITNTNWGPGYGGFAELAFYDSAGSPFTGDSPADSSHYMSNVAANAFDGNTATSWIANGSGAQWISRHFSPAVDVAAFGITIGTDIAQHLTECKLQYSDDNSSWTDATGTITVGSWTGIPYRSFAVQTPAAGNYTQWRVYVSSQQNAGEAIAACEIEMRATSGGSNIATGQQYAASDTYGTLYPANAFDANSSTLWGTHNAPVPCWIWVAFPKALSVAEFTWRLRIDGWGVVQSPTGLSLQGSNDGGNTWSTVATFTAATWTTDGQTQTFTVSGGAAAIAAFVRANGQIGSGIYV